MYMYVQDGACTHSLPQKNIGIAVRLTFETLEGEKTSSELTVVNNGTVAIWYDWRRRPHTDFFQDLKRNRTQRFYFNNREGTPKLPSSPAPHLPQ